MNKTFQNLHSERKEEIIQVSFSEFALKGYKSASLTDIIKRLGIAKGSFYRYFSSKKELYLFLIDEATRRRLAKLDHLLLQPGIDIFTVIRQNFLDKIKFDIDNPVIGGFLYKTMHEKDTSEISDCINKTFEMIIEQTQKVLTFPSFKNQITISDPVLVAFHIFHMQLWLYDYASYKYRINYDENIKNGIPVMNLPMEELEKIIDNAVELLRVGISTPDSKNE